MSDFSPEIPAATQKKGMSGCAIAGIIVGILAIIAIAIAVWAFMKIKDSGMGFSTEPAKVTEMTSSIAAIDLGEKWTPTFSMNIVVVRMALYMSANNDGMAILMDGDSSMGSGEQFEAQMRSSMEEQTQKQGKGIEQTTQISSGRQEFMVRGEPQSFLVVNSEGTESKKKYLEVSGAFQGTDPGRTAFLMMKAPEETISMDDIKAAIESIK